jgi:hypothetical protein
VQPCAKRVARAGAEAPELEERQIRGCAWWIAGGAPAHITRRFRGAMGTQRRSLGAQPCAKRAARAVCKNYERGRPENWGRHAGAPSFLKRCAFAIAS